MDTVALDEAEGFLEDQEEGPVFFRPIRTVKTDGVVELRCPHCRPHERKLLVRGKFTGWVEGYCRHCKKWHTYHEPPATSQRPTADRRTRS